MGQGKWAIVIGLACIAIATSRIGAGEPSQSASTSASTPHEAERQIEAKLGEQLRSRLEFIDTPLNTIMGVLADEYDLPIQFDKRALEAIVASPDQAISVNLSNIKLRSAMALMLNEVQGLTFIVTDEVLLVTTEDEASKRLETKVYRVDDLLGPTRANPGGTGADFATLASAFTTCVAPDSWAQNGQGVGRIAVLEPGMMVVTQTQANHRKVAALIDDLRKTKIAIAEGPPKPAETTAAAPAQPERPVEQRQPTAANNGARPANAANPFDG